MLVISRKPGERVHIGENIQVAILEITGSRVVIGIAAPREIEIRRVGPIPYEPAGSNAQHAEPVDPPPPDVQFEYRYVEPAELSASTRRVPVIKVKRSRLKAAAADSAMA